MDSLFLLREALAHPVRSIGSMLAVRAQLYVLGSVLIGAVALVAAATALLLAPFIALPFAALERARIKLLTGKAIPSAHRPARGGGIRSWALLRLGEGATWRETASFLISPVTGLLAVLAVTVEVLFVGSFIRTPFTAVERPITLGPFTMHGPLETWPLVLIACICLVIFIYFNILIALTFGCITENLLQVRQPDLAHQVKALGNSRFVILDSFDAERRRIERDLHDGIQQQLVNMTLTLGLMRRHVTDTQSQALVERAISQNSAAMTSLRATILGISPPVLADHGLSAALRTLVDGSNINVALLFDPPEYADVRSDPHVERAAYYIVNEALTNVAKHAGVKSATLTLGGDADTVTVQVIDRGKGNARLGAGTGLAGLSERAIALNGSLRVCSDSTGTAVTAELPRYPRKSAASTEMP